MSIINSTNTEYHASRSHLSSSMLKLILQSPEAFYEKWFGPTAPEETKDVFSEGSFVHTLLLEPHKVLTDYAVFTGLRKQGKAWEEFRAANPGKTLLSAPQVARCEELAKAATASTAAMELLSGGFAEHTMVGELLGVPVKARADYINIDKGYIVDVKTTSMPSDKEFFSVTVRDYGYQLSASLYCQIAEATYGKPFGFYWATVSKADKGCRVYKMSLSTAQEGAIMVSAALAQYKRRMVSGDWRDDAAQAPVLPNFEVEEV